MWYLLLDHLIWLEKTDQVLLCSEAVLEPYERRRPDKEI